MWTGYSVMAGFGAKGIQNGRYLSGNTLEEARGVSFAMGGVRQIGVRWPKWI